MPFINIYYSLIFLHEGYKHQLQFCMQEPPDMYVTFRCKTFKIIYLSTDMMILLILQKLKFISRNEHDNDTMFGIQI